MKDGIKIIACAAIDLKDDLYTKMREGGMDHEGAMQASSIAAKANIDEMINRTLSKNDNQKFNAAQITSGLKTSGNPMVN